MDIFFLLPKLFCSCGFSFKFPVPSWLQLQRYKYTEITKISIPKKSFWTKYCGILQAGRKPERQKGSFSKTNSYIGVLVGQEKENKSHKCKEGSTVSDWLST